SLQFVYSVSVVSKPVLFSSKTCPSEPSERRRGGTALMPQVVRFLMSGGLSTLMHWMVLGLLVSNGVKPVVATAMGSCAGALLNYFLQFYWTFGGSGAHGRSVPAYCAAVTLGALLNTGTFHFL